MNQEILVRIIAALLILPLAPSLFAQNAAKPPESKAHPPLYDYLLKEAQKHFDARRQVVAALKSPEQIKKRQDELKAKFLASLGGFPARTPLNPQIVGTLNGAGFRVEKVIYESRPDHHVTANLYLPGGKGPFPGVLVPCGHSDNGKAAEAYQRVCILLAKHGFGVLWVDPIGQGERAQLLDTNHKPGIKGSTTEHTLAGIGALLVGQQAATYRIWDAIRSLDYLAGRPEVDSKRLGCTGNSGGGTETAYLMALDDRIACAAPSCYITSLERLFATIGPQDAEQNITGQVAFGMEHADFITMRAPRPTLIETATYDYFDIQGAWTTFREASLIYAKLGHGERVAFFEYPDKHGFSKPRREAALRWLRRWLQGLDDAPVEPDFPIFTDAQLQCTRSGQVLEDFKGRSVFQMNALAGKDLASQRSMFVQQPESERLEVIRRLLAVPREPLPTKVVDDRIVIVGGIDLPLTGKLRFATKRLTIYLAAGDVPAALKPRDEYDSIIPFAPRGLTPTPAGAGSKYFGTTMKEAFLCVHLGRPLLGQRVQDVLALIDHYFYDDVHLIGVGEAGPIALHAAALDPRVTHVTLEGSLLSWTNVVNTPLSYQQLANVVPGVLKVYDLPELAATLAPRTLTIRNPVDAALRPVSQTDLEAAYEICRSAYARHQASAKLSLQVAP